MIFAWAVWDDNTMHLMKSRMAEYNFPSFSLWMTTPKNENLFGDIQPSTPICSFPGNDYENIR